MNAHLWDVASCPHSMLQALQPWPSHRRELRLYVCAWWRCFPETLDDEGLHLLDCVEALAVGEADEADLSSAIAQLRAAAELDRQWCGNQGLACTWEALIDALRLEWLPGWETTTGPVGFLGTEEERLALDAESAERDRLQCDLLREVMGNPFRPTTFEPRWRTAETLGLAQTIGHERVFDLMPVLGDALEDAGCDAADLLAHCRGPGPHVPGCWALDMVLGYRW